MTYVVSAFYKFFPFPNYFLHRAALKRLLNEHGIQGTILLAPEGINGTVAGGREAIDALHAWFSQHPEIGPIEVKEHYHDVLPFKKTKVRLKKELISLGAPANPMRTVGDYVEAKDWNDLISDPETILIDTRNDYEIEHGTFKGAVNPHIEDFKELTRYVKTCLEQAKDRPIATFCTGGIRCEKFTAYLKEQGFERVYHLKGGILTYLMEVPQQESLWEGECFVFDERVSVGHGKKLATCEKNKS